MVSGQLGAAPALAQDKSVGVVTTIEAPTAHGAITFTTTFEDPRFPGMRFPTTGPIEGVTTTPPEVHQGRAESSAVQSPP
jgi:hypothetical protein